MNLRSGFTLGTWTVYPLEGRLIGEHGEHRPNEYQFSREYIDRVNRELGDLIEEQGYKLL